VTTYNLFAPLLQRVDRHFYSDRPYDIEGRKKEGMPGGKGG